MTINDEGQNPATQADRLTAGLRAVDQRVDAMVAEGALDRWRVQVGKRVAALHAAALDAAARSTVVPEPAVPDPAGASVPSEVLTELGALRARLPELLGSVLATTDGLVIAHDVQGIEPDSIAALAAAHLAITRRFASAANHGNVREAVVECDGGYLTSYTAGPGGVLTLITSADTNLALVHLEARRCVRRLAKLVSVEESAEGPAAMPPDPVPPGALPRRTAGRQSAVRAGHHP